MREVGTKTGGAPALDGAGADGLVSNVNDDPEVLCGGGQEASYRLVSLLRELNPFEEEWPIY